MDYKPRTFVHGSGPKESCKVAGVGEQPGVQEIRRGKVFIGPAGQEWDECLRIASLSRPEIYMTNVIKDLDKPLKKYIDLAPKTPYLSDEWYYYRDYLRNELTTCSANVIVAVGAVAMFALTERRGITNWQGSILESTLLPGRKVIPVIHPATIIPPKNVYLNKRLIAMWLVRAKEESAFPEMRESDRNMISGPTLHQSIEFLNECLHRGLKGSPINLDIELYNEEISCISFSWDELNSISIPFVDHNGDYFTIDQESAVWLAIASILENPNIQKMNQFIEFDVSILLSKYNIRPKNLTSTSVAQKMLFPDYKIALEFPTAQYTKLPYYKADGKRWFKVGGAWSTLWHYSNLDSIAPQEIMKGQLLDLEKQKNTKFFEQQCQLIEPLVYMQERGIRVDTEGMIKEYYETKEKIQELEARIESAVGHSINPGSDKQVANYFYIEKGIKPYTKHRGGGKSTATVDEIAMIRLARRGFEVASLILERRRLAKRTSTYIPVDEEKGTLRKVSQDGRMHSSYNPAGTKTTRLSSSEDIFGYGMNQQNWPHDLLSYLLADEGYVYYAYDLSQIEDRIVANVGNIKEKIEAYANGLDPHKLTGAMIFGIPYDEVSDEPGSSTLGDGKKSQRYWGKRGNHSLNYDLGYKNFSLDHQIPESEGKWIIDRYHTGYSGVRETYQEGVRMLLRKHRTLVNCFGMSRMFLDDLRRDKTYKEAYAQIPQSTTANKANFQGLNYVYYNQHLFAPVELLTQIHDSIGFQIPLSTPWSEHAEMLWLIKQSLETPLVTPPVWGEREFTVPVDLTMGLTLNKNDGHEFKHTNFPKTKEALADELRRVYSERFADDPKATLAS